MSWAEFDRAWADGDWLVQVCDQCGSVSVIPRAGCPHCGAAEWTPAVAEGAGTIRAWTRVHHAFYVRPAGPPPFWLVNVSLDGMAGGSFIAEYIAPDDEPPSHGMPVRLGRHRGADGRERPAFMSTEP